VANESSDDVTVVDLRTSAPISTITVHDAPFELVISPDGTRAYLTTYGSQELGVIDLEADTLLAPTLSLPPRPQGVAITPDGTRLYVALLFSDDVAVIDIPSGTVITRVPVPGTPIGIAITPDGATAFVTSANGHYVTRIDIATNRVVDLPIATGLFPSAIAIG
jgi:YVTN family beta-propeller protein